MDRRRHAAWTPRYGTVRAFVLYGLLLVVVLRGAAPLRETLVAVAGVAPDTAETALLAFLGVVGLAVVVVEVRRQARSEPAFTLNAAREAYLESRVPTRALFGAYVLLLVAGTYVALFARETFFARLDNALLVVRRLAESGDPGAFSIEALVFGTAFVVAAVAVAHAADRVLVAGFRRVLANHR